MALNCVNFDYEQYDKNYFDIIWASPPCDKFSRLRNCWKGREMKNGIISQIMRVNKNMDNLYMKSNFY